MTLTLYTAIQFFREDSSLWWCTIKPNLITDQKNRKYGKNIYFHSINPCCDPNLEDSKTIFVYDTLTYDNTHYTKSRYKRLRSSENIVWTKSRHTDSWTERHTDTVIPIYPPPQLCYRDGIITHPHTHTHPTHTHSHTHTHACTHTHAHTHTCTHKHTQRNRVYVTPMQILTDRINFNPNFIVYWCEHKTKRNTTNDHHYIVQQLNKPWLHSQGQALVPPVR